MQRCMQEEKKANDRGKMSAWASFFYEIFLKAVDLLVYTSYNIDK